MWPHATTDASTPFPYDVCGGVGYFIKDRRISFTRGCTPNGAHQSNGAAQWNEGCAAEMEHIRKMEHVPVKWSTSAKWSIWLSNGAHQQNGACAYQIEHMWQNLLNYRAHMHHSLSNDLWHLSYVPGNLRRLLGVLGQPRIIHDFWAGSHCRVIAVLQ